MKLRSMLQGLALGSVVLVALVAWIALPWPVVLALAFLAACAIDRIQRLMAQRRFPPFYQQVAGAAAATLIAVGAAGVGIEANPSRVVTTGIVMLLAGIGVMGATQDAITGFPVTASARLLDVAPGAPLLSVDRLSYSYGDEVVEWRRGLYQTGAHHYRNDLN